VFHRRDAAPGSATLVPSAVLAGPATACGLGPRAVGLPTWAAHAVPRADGGGDLTVRAVPAVHGPEDGERDADGNVNCEVTGFVLSGWARFSETATDLVTAFDEAGLSSLLHLRDHGTWVSRDRDRAYAPWSTRPRRSVIQCRLERASGKVPSPTPVSVRVYCLR
jgi:hypothetical protein